MVFSVHFFNCTECRKKVFYISNNYYNAECWCCIHMFILWQHRLDMNRRTEDLWLYFGDSLDEGSGIRKPWQLVVCDAHRDAFAKNHRCCGTEVEKEG